MKTFILITLVGCVMFFTSCENDPKTIVDPDNLGRSSWLLNSDGELFQTQGDVFTLYKDDSPDLFDTIRWTPTDFGYSAAITYSIQIAIEIEEGAFSDFRTVETTSNTFFVFTVEHINQCILNGGGMKREENKVAIRISASIGLSFPTVVSNVHHFFATTFSTDPDLLYFVSATTEDISAAEYIFSRNWNSSYEGFAYIPYGDEGVWLVEEIDRTATRWGIESSTEQSTSTLRLITEEEGGQPIMPGAFGTGDIEGSFVEDGYYRVFVDLASETNKRIQVWRFYDVFFVCGQRNMNYKEWGNGMSAQNPNVPAWNLLAEDAPSDPENHEVWGTGATLTYYPEERVWKTDLVFVPIFQTPGGAPPQAENANVFEFKFRANWCCTFNIETGSASSTWQAGVNLGGRQTDVVLEDGIQTGLIGGQGTGPGNPGQGNIRVNIPTAGYYYWAVYLNEYPPRYELVPENLLE